MRLALVATLEMIVKVKMYFWILKEEHLLVSSSLMVQTMIEITTINISTVGIECKVYQDAKNMIFFHQSNMNVTLDWMHVVMFSLYCMLIHSVSWNQLFKFYFYFFLRGEWDTHEIQLGGASCIHLLTVTMQWVLP